MPDLVLHHYPMSPFSEKVRAMLGYADFGWQSVTVHEMPPRPKLEALTGGYRKIPVAQIGADVFCDTRSITREIAAQAGRPELALENNDEAVQAFVREADLDVFLACIIAASGPGMLVKLARSTSMMDALRFLTDRVSIGRTAKVSALSPKQARRKLAEHLERLQGMLEQAFLFGANPCIADFAAYHSLWYVRDLAGKRTLASYPKVNAWMDRMQAFGHGTSREIMADDALAQARAAEPRPVETRHGDTLVGQQVAIAPDDYARDPAIGTLVGGGAHEWVLRRDSDELGTVHVHFPRKGFEIRQA